MDTTFAKNIINQIGNTSFKSSGQENIDQSERIFSIVAGSYLLYKSLKNITKHPILAAHGVASSGLLLYRGATGICPIYERMGKNTTDPEAINITETLTVNVPKEKVYAFWRELSNLPKFMKHLKSVSEKSDSESHWIANTPGNLIPLSWNAEITHEEEGNYIGWQSVEGSMIENAGKVEFKETLNHVGTEIIIEINYFAPAGSMGRKIASLFTGVFEKMIREDIQQFKHYVEETDFKQYAGLKLEEPML